MTESFKFTINFNDPTFDDEERDTEVQKLLRQIKDLESVTADRPLEANPPEGSKAAGGFLVGLLTAEVSIENGKKLLVFLGDRLSRKVIELEVEGNGKKMKVKANNHAELESAIAQAKAFIES